jgi:hypothetical protein
LSTEWCKENVKCNHQQYTVMVVHHYCVLLMITFYIFLASFCGQPLLCIVDDYILHFSCIILWTTITVFNNTQKWLSTEWCKENVKCNHQQYTVMVVHRMMQEKCILASFCGQPLLCIVDDYILHFSCIILWTTSPQNDARKM